MRLAGSRASSGVLGPIDSAEGVWKWFYVITMAALVVRVALALWTVRVDHPDVIFQYLEQAHRLVYGYGYVPWEYRFGTRNWLLPVLLAGILEAFRFAGIDRPALYIPAMNCVFAVLSISLVFSSYVIARRLFGEPAARVAAVITAFWYETLYASSMATRKFLWSHWHIPTLHGAALFREKHSIASPIPLRGRGGAL